MCVYQIVSLSVTKPKLSHNSSMYFFNFNFNFLTFGFNRYIPALIIILIFQVQFHCDVDYKCLVNSIRWYHTTPDNYTTTQIKVSSSSNISLSQFRHGCNCKCTYLENTLQFIVLASVPKI